MTNAFPIHLTDDALVSELQRLAACERAATSKLIAHLAVMDERRLYLEKGFPSLFAYCLQVLHLSEHETYNRIEAARVARRFPVVLERMADASINLTTVRLLAPHLTEDNHLSLLAEAGHKRIEQVKELVARVAPRPDVPPSVRKVSAPARPIVEATPTPPPAEAASDEKSDESGAPESPRPAQPPRPAVVAPLAPDRYEFRFTASAATREKFRYAQDLLRHALPTGDPAAIFDRALTDLIANLERRRFAATEKPRPSPTTGDSDRLVSAEVRRTVWRRDGGRCAFVAADGRRCEARSLLEFHHLRPHAASGPATVENISLRCAAHNRHEADVYFGPIWAARGEGLVEEGHVTSGVRVEPDSFQDEFGARPPSTSAVEDRPARPRHAKRTVSMG
jgi:hypothetical protein